MTTRLINAMATDARRMELIAVGELAPPSVASVSPLAPAASRRRLGRERGGAMVEFALLQIALVPLLLYAIFLMDVPHLMLETQETAISTVWDYSTRNDEGGAAGPSGGDADIAAHITRLNSVLWSDHTSAYEAGVYPDEPNYQDIDWATGNPHHLHHTGFGAQYAFQFTNGPDTQLNCNMANRDALTFDSTDFDSDLSWAVDPAFRSFAGSDFALGGVGRCFVTAYIYNYIVPQQFLQEFSRTDMTKMSYRGENGVAGGETAHDWQGDTSAINNIPIRAEAAVAFNTWALRNGAANGNVNNADLRQPPADNPFMARVREANTAGPHLLSWGNALGRAANFAATGLSEDLIAVPAVNPLDLDDPITAANLPVPVGVYLQARFEPENPGLLVDPPGFGGEEYESTPYEHVNPNYSTAASNRRNHYMGCESAETYPCN